MPAEKEASSRELKRRLPNNSCEGDGVLSLPSRAAENDESDFDPSFVLDIRLTEEDIGA
jgi:hypothetical protein